MDQHKPLSYESLNSVIQYMDANFRLVRSCQIASLRNIQKMLPLRLHVLELNDSTFTLDNVHYEYLHCRKFIERDGGRVITSHSNYDLNNEGEQEIFEDLLPGDIVIKDTHWRGISDNDDNENFISDSYVSCTVRTGLNNPYKSRESHYGLKLRDMMRKRLYEILGGKRIHQVKHLKIGTDHGVLRLPEGLKLKILELTTMDNSMAVIDAVLPILDVSSFPLKRLSITLANPSDPLMQSEILRNSESLNIFNWRFVDNRLANLLINFPNMKIHLRNYIPLDDIVLIVRNWIEQSRVIGTRLSMQAVSVQEYLDEIEKEFKPAIRVLHKKRCITLSMTSTSELNIYKGKSPNDETLGMKQRNMMVMEVMPIGTAQHSEDQ